MTTAPIDTLRPIADERAPTDPAPAPPNVRIRREVGAVFPRGVHDEARLVAAGGPLRAPHHTVGDAAIISELALAAGGVMVLDALEEWRASVVRALFRTASMMHPRARPTLFAVVDTARMAALVYDAARSYGMTCDDPSALFPEEAP